jgi:hypothetical protein
MTDRAQMNKSIGERGQVQSISHTDNVGVETHTFNSICFRKYGIICGY